MVQAGFHLTNAPKGFVPVSPATALKVIFMNNMGLSLDQISYRSGVNVATLQDIESGKSEIDAEIGEKLKAAFGEAAELLLKLQALHSYYVATGKIAPMEMFQSKAMGGPSQGMMG